MNIQEGIDNLFMSIKKHIEGNVHFLRYRAKELWYETDSGLEFPVPIDDIGDASFLNEDKAILFMRYIRKHIQTIEEAKVEHVKHAP